MDYNQIESSQKQQHEIMRHQSEMNLMVEKEEYNLFVIIKPKLYKDGEQWCCLYGEDIQNGVVGFGSTPYESILD